MSSTEKVWQSWPAELNNTAIGSATFGFSISFDYNGSLLTLSHALNNQ
jgi:hypothetical protein